VTEFGAPQLQGVRGFMISLGFINPLKRSGY